MISKIIILEGVDRSGKGTALAQLENLYTMNDFKVVNIFRQSLLAENKQYNDLAIASYEPLQKIKKQFSNHINFDIFSLGALEMIRSIILQHSFTKEQTVILIDRFAISNIIYGEVLRPLEFKTTFENIELVRNYCFAAIQSLTFLAPVELYISTKVHHLFDKIDDTENENLVVTVSQLAKVSESFTKFIESKEFIDFSKLTPNLTVNHVLLYSSDKNTLYRKIREIQALANT